MNPPCFRRGKVQGASMREYELEVLEQYDIDVISTRKTRGAYFCDTWTGRNFGWARTSDVCFALLSGIQTRNEGGHTHLYEGGKTL